MSHMTITELRQKQTAYTIGFLGSLVLTLAAFALVEFTDLRGGRMVSALAILALAQIAIQLLLFLHLTEEARPRLRLWMFAFMFSTIIIVVFGSLWIMDNLDYHMSAHDMNEYMFEQNKKGF